MSSVRPIAELDFDTIKNELIQFIKQNPTFTDYSFEGSALNAIMDLLAYNTHYNAFYANMVHNESFLDSSQKRSSVVSRAKELGYTTRSSSSSTAYVNINVLGVDAGTTSFVLPRGTEFKSENDFGQHTFISSKDETVIKSGNNYSFSNIELKEGVLLSNYFKVDLNNNPRQIFTIPNTDVDLDTLQVFVRENQTSTVRLPYIRKNDSFDIGPDSRIFFIQESFDGRYQIYFGDDVLGKKLDSSNIVEISYIVTKKKEQGNGCQTFVLNGTIGPSQSSIVTTVQNSFGGRDKESINEIKFNAVKFNSARNRSVTSDDYSALLKSKFNFIKSVNTFGGQDADPPVYGKVFVCVQPEDGLTITNAIKETVLLPAIKESNVLTIIPEILDPSYTLINLNVLIKYNKNKTTISQSDTVGLVASRISTFFQENVSSFNRDYLESELIGEITNLDPGISSIVMTKELGLEIYPLASIQETYKTSFNNVLIPGSINSSYFVTLVANVPTVCQIRDNPEIVNEKTDSRGRTRYYSPLQLLDKNNIVIQDIGTVEYSSPIEGVNGTLEFTLRVDSFLDTSAPKVIFYGKTTSTDIISLRNQILIQDENVKNSISGIKQGLTISVETYER